jgi:hypothetical protein
MKKALLTGVAVLFLATGTAHSDDPETERDFRIWCRDHPDTRACSNIDSSRPNYGQPWKPAEPPGSEKDKELAEAQRLRDRAIVRNPKRARFCIKQFGQDGEALESIEEEAGFDHCMKSVSPKEICSVFGKGSEFESKAEYKRCLARLARGDEAYRSFLICVGRVGHKETEQGACGPAPPPKRASKSKSCVPDSAPNPGHLPICE